MTTTVADKSLAVIDDEAGFRLFVRRVAESCGFQVFETGDVPALLEHLRLGPPTAVILDLRMPGVDGIELLRLLARENLPSRIFLASGVDPRILETAWRLGSERGLQMAGIIQKPVRVEQLRTLLSDLAPALPPTPRVPEGAGPIDEALATALESDDEFFLEFQPRLDLQTGRVTGAEALARWRHPRHGLVAPDLFIPAAERTSLIHRLTRRVIDLALAACAGWQERGSPLAVAINISARDASHLDLPDWAARGCEMRGVAPEQVTLELTETAVSSDAAGLMDVLTRLRLKGFHLAMDDFGTGHSSLSRLQRLPFSELKIDKSFLRGVPGQADNTAIARNLIAMGQELGLQVTAEGVETAEALHWLRSAGCPAAQGFYVGRPMSADALVATAATPFIQ